MTKTKEQLEEEKKISLSIRIIPLELVYLYLCIDKCNVLNGTGRDGPRGPEGQGGRAVGADCQAGDRAVRPGGADQTPGLRCNLPLLFSPSDLIFWTYCS